MSNLACFYSAPLAVSCGFGLCDAELEAAGTRLTCIPYMHYIASTLSGTSGS